MQEKTNNVLQQPCTENEWLVARVKRFLKVDVKKKTMMNATDNAHNTNSECDNVLGDHFEAEKQSLRICSALMHGIFAGTCKKQGLAAIMSCKEHRGALQNYKGTQPHLKQSCD